MGAATAALVGATPLQCVGLGGAVLSPIQEPEVSPHVYACKWELAHAYALNEAGASQMAQWRYMPHRRGTNVYGWGAHFDQQLPCLTQGLVVPTVAFQRALWGDQLTTTNSHSWVYRWIMRARNAVTPYALQVFLEYLFWALGRVSAAAGVVPK
jgi:hypothetical protein